MVKNEPLLIISRRIAVYEKRSEASIAINSEDSILLFSAGLQVHNHQVETNDS